MPRPRITAEYRASALSRAKSLNGSGASPFLARPNAQFKSADRLVTILITQISHSDPTLAGESARPGPVPLQEYLDRQARLDQGAVIAALDLSVKSAERQDCCQ
jgi:hypothetical protein